MMWDKVLKNYMPKTYPILFRSCSRRKAGKIASFTGRIECANRFSGNKNCFLIICDTKKYIHLSKKYEQQGEYTHTFFPLTELIRKEISHSDSKFSKNFYAPYLGEDEYIMRVNLNWMYSCKWYQERGEHSEMV